MASNPIEVYRVKMPLSVLPDQEWRTIFPKETYQKVKAKDSSVSIEESQSVTQHSLKYLIALDQPDKNIIEFIQSLGSKRSNQINSSFPSYRITALHIAVMKNKQPIVEELLKAGANPIVEDEYGWTPLHHAALISDQLVQMLLRSISQQKATDLKDKKTNLGGNYEDLMCLTSIKSIRSPAKIFYMSNRNKELKQINNDFFLNRFNFTYIDECFWPENMLYQFWTSKVQETTGRSYHQYQIRSDLYPVLRSSSIEIILKEEISEFHPPDFEILAGQDFHSLELIGEYIGRITQPTDPEISDEELTYSFILEQMEGCTISVDAAKEGNWTRFINDGFPNVFSFDLFNTGGQKWRKLFFVADNEGIKAKEQILYDYNWQYFTLKWGSYKLNGKEKMRSFFGKCHVSEYSKTLKTMIKEEECQASRTQHIPYSQVLKYRALESRLLYPFQTPMALMDLVFSRIIDPEQWLKFIQDEKQDENSSVRCVFCEENRDAQRIEDLLQQLILFNNNLETLSKKFSESLANKIRECFINYEEKIPVTELYGKISALNLMFIYKENPDFIGNVNKFLGL